MLKRLDSVRCRNLLLAALSDEEHERFNEELERVEGTLGDSLVLEYEHQEWAYFPETAVASIVRILTDGSMIEVGLIGFEGMVGIQSLAEEAEQPFRVVVQNPGALWRMPMRRLREEFRRGGEFQRLLLRFSNMFLAQVSQTAACNRLHNLEQRLARWLLMMRDRTSTDELKLTQEFLSHMLGTRLAGVNEALGSLTNSGLVKHARRSIQIIDREGLEMAACECYAFLKGQTASPGD